MVFALLFPTGQLQAAAERAAMGGGVIPAPTAH